MKSKSLKKVELINDLSNKTGFSINFSKKIVDDLIDVFSQNIKFGYLSLKNIGVFRLINKKQRIGRNPKTGEEFVIRARKSVSFKPSKKIKNIVNAMNKFKSITQVSKELKPINANTKKPANYILRYWEKEFKLVKPKIINKRRYYSDKQVETLKLIKSLLKDKEFAFLVQKILKSNILNLTIRKRLV